MTAGAVAAPLIIPIIHQQTHGAKNHIDTNTPVSIQSDTPAVLIFYTLDGSKPAAAQRWSAGSSRKYSEPILLPAGRVAVRALALTSDGRESSTVTKVFFVEPVDSNSRKEENVLQSDQLMYCCLPSESRIMGNTKSRLGFETGSCQRSQSGVNNPPLTDYQSSAILKQLNCTQTSRIQKETDFLRCAQCLTLRPLDPFARFCAQCGAVVPPLPEQRLPPAEGGQTLRCVFCHTVVPVNTETCLICEASIHQQLQPQSSLRLQDHVVCVSCGCGNPAHVSRCLTCESRLQPATCVGAPSVLSAVTRKLSCCRCKRINHSDARYCDWCGSKPSHAASCTMCWQCGASGHPYAFYCAACGVFLEAPALPTSCSDVTQSIGGAATNQATPSSGPVPGVMIAPPTAEKYTQTVGLYYPSATEIHRKEQQRTLQLSREQVTRDRKPLLTAISPGRGYWRKQLDHVCAHLRSYAQNNTPFRALLGEPRLGRMVSAVIQEDRYEVSLTVSFVLAEREEKKVHPEGGGPAGDTVLPSGQENLSSVTERSTNSSSLRSDLPALMKPPKQNPAPKPLGKNSQLLRELGPGRGQISVVQQLLDQGADPSYCGSDGRHALAVAVVNGHHDVLPVLVQRGANTNQQSGQMKNTALHEAAALGSDGLQCAEVLLSCKASLTWRNAAGQTAYDVAVSSGCDVMVSLLAARTGSDILSKLAKPKRKLHVF
ncbi:hypothetical protein PAMP_021625 [Pampus punctatissimus]